MFKKKKTPNRYQLGSHGYQGKTRYWNIAPSYCLDPSGVGIRNCIQPLLGIKSGIKGDNRDDQIPILNIWLWWSKNQIPNYCMLYISMAFNFLWKKSNVCLKPLGHCWISHETQWFLDSDFFSNTWNWWVFLKIKYPPHTGLDQCCRVLRFMKESLVLVPKIFIKTKNHQFWFFIYL